MILTNKKLGLPLLNVSFDQTDISLDEALWLVNERFQLYSNGNK